MGQCQHAAIPGAAASFSWFTGKAVTSWNAIVQPLQGWPRGKGVTGSLKDDGGMRFPGAAICNSPLWQRPVNRLNRTVMPGFKCLQKARLKRSNLQEEMPENQSERDRYSRYSPVEA
jgi:hypothetical protein